MRQHGAGRLSFYESSPTRKGISFREDEDDAMARIFAPLPASQETCQTKGVRTSDCFIACSTEVVMARISACRRPDPIFGRAPRGVSIHFTLVCARSDFRASGGA